jgi:hypothetical protein
MPITLINSTFTDVFGNNSDVFKANAGDKVTCSFEVQTANFTSSDTTNNITIDKLFDRLSRSSGSWIEDGFRIGDTYTFKVVDNVNSVVNTYTGTISEVYDTYMIMSGLPSLNGTSSQSSGYIYVIYTSSTFDYLKLGVNFVDNDNTNPTLISPIDGESCIFSIEGINSVIVGGSLTLNQLGKKSGGFEFTNIEITRNANVSDPWSIGLNVKSFTITYDVIFYGHLFQDAFKGAKCLKLYSQFECKQTKDEKYNPYKFEIKDKCDTGYFDEGYNSEQSNVTSITGVSTLYYNSVNTFNFSVTLNDNTLTEFELGGAYITIDEDLNQNLANSQENYLPTLRSGVLTDTSDGWTGSSSANTFDLTLNSVTKTILGGNVTFAGEIELNPLYASANDFGKFIESRGDSERVFKLWFKCGNTNATLFSGQLEYQQPVGIEITPLFTAYVNHDNNNDLSDMSVPTENTDINIHDNIAVVVDFERNTSDNLGNIIGKIVCYNTDTDEEFVLDSITFDCSTQDPNNWVLLTQNLDYGLPTSSSKQISYVGLRSGVSGGVYELRLYFPILIRWEDWINELNATSYFKSNLTDTKNWINYQVAPYELRFKLEIERDGVFDYAYKSLVAYDYDDSTITSTIQLFDITETTEYNTVLKGDTLLVKATHIHPTSWGNFPWGEITIEPQQGKPWQLTSTEIDCDLNNPLYGINNDRVELNLTAPNTIELTCLLDSNKISGNFTITSKISEDGTDNNHVEYDKIMESGIAKLTENSETKITD